MFPTFPSLSSDECTPTYNNSAENVDSNGNGMPHNTNASLLNNRGSQRNGNQLDNKSSMANAKVRKSV